MSTLADVAHFRPGTIEEALDAMEQGLKVYRKHNDSRSVFLRAYHIITGNVSNAINQQQDFDNPIFFDPEWIRLLSGKFATLYFASLEIPSTRGTRERAWRIAHGMATNKRSSVVQDLLLGINAHINYDLPVALCQNLKEHGDDKGASFLQLTKRKFDHDQVNNILIRSFDEISTAIPREFGGLMGVADLLLGNIDETLTRHGLKYYRERVWWDGLSLLSAESEDERRLVMNRLDWESAKIAEIVAGENSSWVRAVNRMLKHCRKAKLSQEI